MLNHLKKILFIAVVVCAIACHSKQDQIPVAMFFSSQVGNFHISPDGKYISYLKRNRSADTIILENIATGKKQSAATFSDVGVRDHFWAYNGLIIVPQADRQQKTFHLYAIDPATLQMQTLLVAGKVNFRLLSRNIQHPDELTFTMNLRDSSIFDVYRINTKSGEMKMYLKNPGNITQFYTDIDGTIRLEKASDGVNETILFRSSESAAFKPILSNNFKNLVEPIAFTGEKNYFYARSNVNRDKIALVEINAEDGKEQKVIFGSDKADIDEVTYSRVRRRLDMVAWQEAKPQRHILDESIKAIYADLEQQLPGDQIRLSDRDTVEHSFIINTSSDRNPGSTYLYVVATKKLTKLNDMNPGISPDDLCEMKPIQFKAGDSTLINGYLTLPKGSSGKNLPVVVMPHSDFWYRNTWGYSAEVQFLANRGYAVFQVNYRGSTGYGKAFYSAGFKQMGGKMQQDITDGVKWLIGQQIADPKRIAIYGSHFGGFSALYGISFHPELYSCAVVQNPFINLFTFINDVPPFLKPKLSMLYEMVGNPATDADQFKAVSPIFNINKFKAPLMIDENPRDPSSNINELTQFVGELKKNGVSVNYSILEGRRGGKSKKQNRQSLSRDSLMYSGIEKFLEINLGKK